MLLPTLDIALRGATVALLLVLAASLFRGFGTVLAGRLARPLPWVQQPTL